MFPGLSYSYFYGSGEISFLFILKIGIFVSTTLSGDLFLT